MNVIWGVSDGWGAKMCRADLLHTHMYSYILHRSRLPTVILFVWAFEFRWIWMCMKNERKLFRALSEYMLFVIFEACLTHVFITSCFFFWAPINGLYKEEGPYKHSESHIFNFVIFFHVSLCSTTINNFSLFSHASQLIYYLVLHSVLCSRIRDWNKLIYFWTCLFVFNNVWAKIYICSCVCSPRALSVKF